MSSIFDYTINNTCSSSNYISITDCKLPTPYNNISSLRNLSTVPGSGPTLLVPQYDETALPPACVITNYSSSNSSNPKDSTGVCLHYASEELQQFDKSPLVSQQTFHRVISRNNTKWVQDITPLTVPTMPNPTDIGRLSNPNISVLSYSDYLGAPKRSSDNQVIVDSNRSSRTSVLYINSSKDGVTSTERKLVAYDNTSDVAPQCIFPDLSCTNADFTLTENGCDILCPTVDETKLLKYTYNDSVNLWLNSEQLSSLK